MSVNIGIPDKQLKEVALELNKLLADEFVLYTKTRNYHWNIEGPHFMELHKFYESQYEQLDEIIDSLAERVRSIGHYAQGRLKDYLQLTYLLEPEYSNNQRVQLENLLQDHETIIVNLRKMIPLFADTHKDIGTSDFITGLLKEHERMAWFIRSFIN